MIKQISMWTFAIVFAVAILAETAQAGALDNFFDPSKAFEAHETGAQRLVTNKKKEQYFVNKCANHHSDKELHYIPGHVVLKNTHRSWARDWYHQVTFTQFNTEPWGEKFKTSIICEFDKNHNIK